MKIFIIFIILLMLCSVLYLLFLVYLGLCSKKWSYSAGKIIEYKIQNARFVSLQIKYEYMVNGNKYIGSRISFMNPVYNTINELESDALYNIIKKDNLDVFYLESYPRISTLKTGFNSWLITIFLISMHLMGLFWLSTYIR